MSARRRRLKSYDEVLLAGQPVSEDQRTDYPTGWYFARFGEDLKRGQVVPVEFMSRQFALFRAKNGEVGMIDSQCCHMGADLARSGWVTGDRLACGYHAWEFGADGRCMTAPGVPENGISKRARQFAVPVVERAGNIYFWYGPEPVRDFVDIGNFESNRYLNVKGKLWIGRGEPGPISEHIVDSYHFPYSHRIMAPVSYTVIADDGDRFEFQLHPKEGAKASSVQRLFTSHAFGEMLSPTAGVYRTQKDFTIDRDNPKLVILTSSTPVREGLFTFTYRLAVRKIGPDPWFKPLNWALGRLMFHIVKWNYNSDMEVLSWMRALSRPLSVKPEGPAVRQYRAFYRRNIIPGWRWGDPAPPEAEPLVAELDRVDEPALQQAAGG